MCVVRVPNTYLYSCKQKKKKENVTFFFVPYQVECQPSHNKSVLYQTELAILATSKRLKLSCNEGIKN